MATTGILPRGQYIQTNGSNPGPGPYAPAALGIVVYTHTALTSSQSSQQALAANTQAKYRLFQNIDNAQPIALYFGGNAVNSQGIILFPFQSYECSLAKGNMDVRVVNFISPYGTPILLVTEGQ